jgi:hypothetical protein
VARGVSPLKIMVNFASAADFVADNSTAEGRRENQRVDIEVVSPPTERSGIAIPGGAAGRSSSFASSALTMQARPAS